jgi:hypothetical protein
MCVVQGLRSCTQRYCCTCIGAAFCAPFSLLRLASTDSLELAAMTGKTKALIAETLPAEIAVPA